MYRGEKVILRAYEQKDVPRAHHLFNNYQVQRMLNMGAVLPVSYAEEEKHIYRLQENRDQVCGFAIETFEGEYIGGCGYFEVDHRNRRCSLGIAIADEQYWGKGFGTDAMRVLLRILFEEVNLRKVCLSVFSFNEPAIRCYERLGFVEEGRLREHLFREGRYHDNILMALFRKAWLARQAAGTPA